MRQVAVLVIVGVYGLFFLRNAGWQDHVSGGGDSWGYYAYLPALFIQKDLRTLRKTISVRQEMHPESVSVIGDTLRVGEAPALGEGNVFK
ncbi:MAG: hypothetical protein R3301_14580, partial [Saprospiraceae bacterium]|nr:hypothetical protein [Saprospiraceae bacterium]